MKAEEKRVAPFQILNDKTLKELSIVRPSTKEKMKLINGIGDQKLIEFGDQLLNIIIDFCKMKRLNTDNELPQIKETVPAKNKNSGNTKEIAKELFKNGESIETIISKTGRAKSTVLEYLASWIIEDKIQNIENFISKEKEDLITQAIDKCGRERLKPIYLELKEKISYEEIKIVLAKLRVSE